MAVSRQKYMYALLLSDDFKVFFILHSNIDITIYSKPLNSSEHCMCTTPMTNIRHGRD